MTTQTFEDSIEQLEKIVALLQSGDLPLDKALELFEQGVHLSRQCQSQLEAAERKVDVLLREKGELKTAPFDTLQRTADNWSGASRGGINDQINVDDLESGVGSDDDEEPF